MTDTGVDVDALRRYFEREVPEFGGELGIELIHGGRSNLTYAVTDGTRRWVLRRPPLGHLTPTAHDVGREFRVMAALGPTDVPVPRTVVSCEDPAVLGVPFTIVSHVDGPVLRDGAALPEIDVRRYTMALVDELVKLHALVPAEIGLGAFGRPEGFLGRQLRRWRGQWDRVATRELTTVGDLHERLVKAAPAESGAVLVHGDYRWDNTILAPGEPSRIAAIVDWEMAALGDPLTDLGLLLVYWDPRVAPVLGVRHVPTAHPGFPAAADLAGQYARRSGRDLTELAFYQALGWFKLAVIAEGIHARHRAGQSVGTGYDEVGAAVPGLVGAGLALLT
ncbi:phosphotransferase family protein [Amycolatopsis balhimycina DSM 5908]|uniref:Phosphotransferase family protein n=1 Tax=Amycolatopsis balhimycina DSM 5908 TaxID=1081091 RepID=A0A428W3Z3_AMYBA|nr:phosphotransferase family protein [Amycolatopsis balhimycina]RSM37802.1 phosphotransferase family protein [Amycolatopsis balhimycina DSM 5908]